MNPPKWIPPSCDFGCGPAVWKSSGIWTDPDNGFASRCTLYACETGHGGTDSCVPSISKMYTDVQKWEWCGPAAEKRVLRLNRSGLGDMDMATDARPDEIERILREPVALSEKAERVRRGLDPVPVRP